KPPGVFSQATIIEVDGYSYFRDDGASRRRHDTGTGDIAAQTRQVCENLKAAVETGGGTMNDICRVDVYVRNIEQFEAIHKVRREYFKAPLPASTHGRGNQNGLAWLPNRNQCDCRHTLALRASSMHLAECYDT